MSVVNENSAIQPGYKSQWQDCMICNYVGGPLIIRFKKLGDIFTEYYVSDCDEHDVNDCMTFIRWRASSYQV